MTLSEFRAWFDGFTEDMIGPPNSKQWKRIQARVKEITGSTVSYPVYVDRYVRPHWNQPHWVTYATGLEGAGQAVGSMSSIDAQPHNSLLVAGNVSSSSAFDSHKAMNDLGRLDAAALAN